MLWRDSKAPVCRNSLRFLRLFKNLVEKSFEIILINFIPHPFPGSFIGDRLMPTIEVLHGGDSGGESGTCFFRFPLLGFFGIGSTYNVLGYDFVPRSAVN